MAINMAPNPLVLKALIGLSLVATIIYAISSFVVAAFTCGLTRSCIIAGSDSSASFGTSPGEGFLIVMFGLAWAAYCAASFYSLLPGKLGPIFSGAQLSTSFFTILSSLFLSVWAGLKRSTMSSAASTNPEIKLSGNYTGALSAMVAGASMLLIFQVAYLVVYSKWRNQLLDTGAGAASVDSSAYAASYEPNAYFDSAAAPQAQV